MKRLLLILLILVIAVTTTSARKRKPRSGTIDNGLFADTANGYELSLPVGWKAKRQLNSKNVRLTLKQEKYQGANSEFAPSASIWVAPVTLTPGAFVDSLLNKTYSSDLKTKILEMIPISEDGVSFNGFKTKKKKLLKISGQKAVYWKGSLSYSVTIGGKRMTKSFGAGFIGLKIGDDMLMFFVVSEQELIKEILIEFETMAQSVKLKN